MESGPGWPAPHIHPTDGTVRPPVPSQTGGPRTEVPGGLRKAVPSLERSGRVPRRNRIKGAWSRSPAAAAATGPTCDMAGTCQPGDHASDAPSPRCPPPWPAPPCPPTLWTDRFLPFGVLPPVGGEGLQSEPPPRGIAWAWGLFELKEIETLPTQGNRSSLPPPPGRAHREALGHEAWHRQNRNIQCQHWELEGNAGIAETTHHPGPNAPTHRHPSHH